MARPKRHRITPAPKRRRLPDRQNVRVTSLVLPTDLHQRTILTALALNWTLGEVVRVALVEWFERHSGELPRVSIARGR